MDTKYILNKILGRPLASNEHKDQQLSILTGIPALGLDSLASTAYGPEAALLILLPLGTAGLSYFLPVSIAVVFVLILLYLSYMQTIAAYPNGGGAYLVASENLGKLSGVCAAVALLLDYLLNVAVGISAGVGAIVSAIPFLQPYTVILCLSVLLMLTILNLRGIKESGIIFVVPVMLFVICLMATCMLGLFYSIKSGGHPTPVVSPPAFPISTESVGLWLLLGTFANGLTAMTGVEAVSNAVPLFRKPVVSNARWTLTIIIGILGIFLLCLGYLCPSYHIAAMNEARPGYQTILSQLVAAVTGKGVFYYISIVNIFIVLTYSAQTSFAGFPRVCRLLAEDYYLPYFFAEKGRRLVFTHGILVLAIFSAILLIAFNGITTSLIPLFAVGAFSAFLFSQSGMVLFWLRKNEPGTTSKLICNAMGTIITLIALIIIIAVKFMEGAWIVMVVAPLLVLLLTRINRHYQSITREIEHSYKFDKSKLQPPIVIIPINGWNLMTEKAVEFGLLLSDQIVCVYISTEENDDKHWLRGIWNVKIEKPAQELNAVFPKLEIIKSPYRRINKPILDFVKKVRKYHPDELITVVIPELVEPHWYEYVLHNIHAARLRASLFLERDPKTIVITIPWYLRCK